MGLFSPALACAVRNASDLVHASKVARFDLHERDGFANYLVIDDGFSWDGRPWIVNQE
jgi:hypothetical protein